MKLVRATPEQIAQARNAHFESLSGEQRLQILRTWMQRLEKPGYLYEFKGLKVRRKSAA
ncbi:MAG: hypothetical protein MUC38_02795 [Cyclobacteriaceae bacterium]|jgi:hypothetical protein|nr:hypothetical protein [Cyclobacteriaceae bacterium]